MDATDQERIAAQRKRLDKIKALLQELHESAVVEQRHGRLRLDLVYKDGTVVQVIHTNEASILLN